MDKRSSAIKRTELAQRVGRAQCLYSIPRSHVLRGWLRGIPLRGCVVSGDNTKQQLGNYSVTVAFGMQIALTNDPVVVRATATSALRTN